MTQVSAAPQPMPGAAPCQAAAAPGAAADAAAGAEGTTDFAAVLKAQIARPAKDAPAAENFAALLPQAAEAVEETSPAEVLPPDLSALLPALAGITAPPATEAPVESKPSSAEPAGGALPGLAAAATASPIVASAAMSAQAAEAAPPALQAATPLASGLAAPAVQAEPAAATATELQMPAAAAEQASPTAQTHAAAPLAPAARDSEAMPAMRVDTPVGNRGWDAEVGQKIVLLANRQESRAELTLTPPQLGRVEVTISVSGDQTSAAFVSASPAAREALEQALPRLREILAEAGITLGQASVNAESPRQDRESTPGGERAGEGNGRSDERAVAPAQMHWLRRSEGLVDTFA